MRSAALAESVSSWALRVSSRPRWRRGNLVKWFTVESSTRWMGRRAVGNCQSSFGLKSKTPIAVGHKAEKNACASSQPGWFLRVAVRRAEPVGPNTWCCRLAARGQRMRPHHMFASFSHAHRVLALLYYTECHMPHTCSKAIPLDVLVASLHLNSLN